MEDHEFLSSYWHDINIDVDRDGITPREKADGLRKILMLLGKLKSSKLISNDLYLALQTSTYRKYTAVVDSMKDGEGMNNYADSILQLVSGLRNQSHLWKSSLNISDTESSPPFIKEMLQKATQSDQKCGISLRYISKTSRTSNVTGEKTLSENCLSEINKPKTTLEGNAAHRASLASSSSCIQGRHSDDAVAVNSDIADPKCVQVTPAEDKPPKQSLSHPGSNRNGNAIRNPNNYARTNPAYEKASLKQSLENSSMQDQQALIAKRKYDGSNEHSVKQAQLDPNFGNSRVTFDKNEIPRAASGSTSTHSSSQHKFSKCFPKRRYENSNSPNIEEESNDGEICEKVSTNPFLTARDQYIIDQRTKNRYNHANENRSITQSDYGVTKKSLGTRRGTSNRFVPPVMGKQQNGSTVNSSSALNERKSNSARHSAPGHDTDERLKNIDQRMIEMIENEIMDHGPPITWDDIAGLEFAKNTIQEIVIWPMLRPDIFKGLRGPPKGILLFGPPGTGKTLIGKCIASQSHATFFSISASSLTSKWIGEGEKMVRALFSVARCQESAVIFIDEIDSLLSQRSDGEHEATRRIKTEFLIQLDGATTKAEERILVVGATNRPQELDEAARRRLVKRLYIPLPEAEARKQIVSNLMKEQMCSLDENDFSMIMENSQGYSGADMANLCREAALGPIRSISLKDIRYIKSDEVRPIVYKDFQDAFRNIRPSVSQKDLELYTEWNKMYGSGGV